MKLEKLQPISISHNVAINVVDERTGTLISHHEGHNAATNSMLVGVGKYLAGDGVFNQGKDMLRNYVPQYISLGTLGLSTQDQDSNGLPTGIGPQGGTDAERFTAYMVANPGYGADGYSAQLNNGREVFGLGLPYTDYLTTHTYYPGDKCMRNGVEYTCVVTTSGNWIPDAWTSDDARQPAFQGELITPTFPRAKISFREVVPERYSELPETIDVIYSAMISTGALRQFRFGDNDYIFISEAGLWSRPNWEDNGANGLIAGYRIAPPDRVHWGMSPDTVTEEALEWFRRFDPHPPASEAAAREYIATTNRQLLRRSIIRVGPNQVVQVVWKIQLGSIEQFGGLSEFYQQYYTLYWNYGGQDARNCIYTCSAVRSASTN